jgi:hypothetical protein
MECAPGELDAKLFKIGELPLAILTEVPQEVDVDAGRLALKAGAHGELIVVFRISERDCRYAVSS